MCPEETSRELPHPLLPDAWGRYEAIADDAAAASIPGCDVTEYDEESGQKEWDDSVFVQDFTDSVLDTTPAPFDFKAV